MAKSDAQEYLENVIDGKIVACKRIKQLAEMMLPRFADGYGRWHFDAERAERPVRFIEQFCILPESGKPFVMEPFQKCIVQIAFGFVDDDGLRQFQEVLMVCGRKNGKTQLSSALELFMLVGDGEGAPQVYNVATSKSQASLAYGAALKMMRKSHELSNVLRKGIVPDRDQDGIIFDKNDGYITVLTNQTRHLDGLNVHLCIFDEMAACTNRDQYDLVKQGMSARDQPLLWAITTNGFERDNLFDERYEYACGILDGKVSDDRMLPVIYELDSREEWTDESCWVKANPGLGAIKNIDYLRGCVNQAKQSPSFLPTVMTKEFNVPETRTSAWLSFDEAVNEEPFPELPESGKLSDIGFRYGIAGFDASDTTDLSAAKMLMMREGDPKIYELSMYWLPEDALRKGSGYRRERDDVPYRLWEQRGLLRTVPGNIIPKSVFVDWLEEIKEKYDVWTFSIGYDPWGFQEWHERFEAYVGKERSEIVRQGPQTFSAPMKQLRAMLASNLIVDGHNPMNEYCRMNVSVKIDSNANVSPVKAEGKAVRRIDGFMAELNAYVAYLRHKDEYEGNL